VTQGLKVMARRDRAGIAALLAVAQAKDAPTAHTLGYLLGPRINASGRIAESDLGLRLLVEDDEIEARIMAETLDDVNKRRQEVEAGVLGAAFAAAEQQVNRGHPVLLVVGEGWHPGVVGIVAGRIKEKYNRPALVAGLSGGLAKGSGRSVAGVDLGSAIIAARQMGLLETGGGHAMAAGFSFRPAREGEFHAFLDERLSHAADLPEMRRFAKHRLNRCGLRGGLRVRRDYQHFVCLVQKARQIVCRHGRTTDNQELGTLH